VTPDIVSWVSKTWDAVISDKRKKGYVEKLPSGNLWVSCDKFIEIKGFNEELITNEDFDLCFRLLQKGYKIYSDPAITAWHWGVPRTVGEFYRKNRWHGVHVFKVFLDNFPRLNNVKPIMFGLYYLVITMLVPVALIYFHLFIVLLISAVTLLIPSLWLSWRVVRNKNESFTFFFKLFILYFVYGVARAHSILDSVVGFFRSRI
jgi:GT2 family glycosyltransferase